MLPSSSPVALISSVSGGSLGSLIYAASFAHHIKPEEVIPNSRASAINGVAWGWTYPDFFRSLAPWLVDGTSDRGWALEEKWAAVNKLSTNGRDTYLSDWATRGAAIGRGRPYEQQIGAHAADAIEHRLPRAIADGEHRDDRRDADDDA